MRNEDQWKPTKFIKTRNSFRATSELSYVGISYRFIGSIQAKNYFQLIKKHATGLLFDLGCGNAPLYEMYKPFVSKIICADWPNSFHKFSFLDFQTNLNMLLPVKDTLFDTILLTDVLEHISNPGLLWAEMTRVLKPKGKIIVAVPFFHLLHEEPYDFFRYTEYRLKLYCEENKLKVVELYPYGGSLEIFFDMIAKHLTKFKIISIFHHIFARVICNSFIGKKIYSLTSSKYPLGYCLVAQK